MSTLNLDRQVIEIIKARPSSDGAGVKLLRVFGGNGPERFDPFLLLDEFGSEKADDYLAGFPPHPHRGFETVTYMLQGQMEHRDHMDNVGLLKDGGVQWMTAGKGVIHSEMPKQTEGKLRGFQLWLNLPSHLKMTSPSYKDIQSEKIPKYTQDSAKIIAIAGEGNVNNEDIKGYFQRNETQVLYFDVHVKPNDQVNIQFDKSFNSLVYVYDGSAFIGDTRYNIGAQNIARLGEGDFVKVTNAGSSELRFLILAGKPLKEPISQYGPYVMNTPEEINKAINDYLEGTLTDTQLEEKS